MASYLLSLLTPASIDAANTADRDVLSLLQDMTRRYARKAGEDIDPEDVAAVAALLAPSLLKDGHGASEAASVAVNRAIVAARRDLKAKGDAASIDGATTEDGTVLLRLVTPHAPDPAAAYGTTNRDRYLDAMATLDAPDRWTAHALLSAEWKGGKVPAAAVRRGHGLPPVTGRAGTAWTATVTEDAARVLPALQEAYREALTLHWQGCEGWEPSSTYGTPRLRRPIDAKGREADRTAKVRPSDDSRRVEDSRATSGPASLPAVWDRRAADRLGILDGGARRRATEADRATALTPSTRLTEDAFTLAPGQGKRERDAFDHEAAAEGARGRRLPGVSVEKDGTLCAPSGVSGAGAGSGKAALRPAAPRKASRTGGTGATIPAGPRR